MRQKEKIIDILKTAGTNANMTQSEIAEKIYGDKEHTTYIYDALANMVKKGIIKKSGNRPFRYTLTDQNIMILPQSKTYGGYRDVSQDLITNATIEEMAQRVDVSGKYGPENEIITECLKRFPENTDPFLVVLKIGLIDITNSTHLSQHKQKINMAELAHIIAAIPRIDERIQTGDPEVVTEIAKSNGKINLFSFASKYCCYHNRNLYEQDDYSIYDTVLHDYLPRYFEDVTYGQIENWRKKFDYKAYNDYITHKLDELEITVPYRKRKFDHFVWYKNR